MLRVVVCVSGGGTNLQAIIDAVESGKITNAQIVGVFSNNKNAFALERAKKASIDGVCISPKDFDSREDFNKAFLSQIDSWKPDLIVLAGFLVIIPEELVAKYKDKIIKTPTWIDIDMGAGFGREPVLLRLDDFKEFRLS